ncbi:MAG: NUDIX hydrolase [Bacteroidales bacterium]
MRPEEHIENLRKKLGGKLPGWDIQKKFLPSTPIPGVKYTTEDEQQLRKGAVLTCLYIDNGEIMTILIERTVDTSPHSGQIAFPGGKYEKEDKTQVRTALREAEEEVGLPGEQVEVIGSLSPVKIPVSGFTVLPVIGYYHGIPDLTPCPHEVNTMIQTPLIPLIKSLETRKIIVRGYEIETPVFTAGGHIVWGATAMVLGELRAVLTN